LNATDDTIEISGEQSEEEERGDDRTHNYIYNERSYKSFYRSGCLNWAWAHKGSNIEV